MTAGESARVGRLCPRCGMPFNYLRERRMGSNVYVYTIHREGKKLRYCYLGPKEYIYTTTTHPGLAFEGMRIEGDYWRLIAYLKEIVEALSRAEVREEDREAVSREVGAAVKRLTEFRLSLAG